MSMDVSPVLRVSGLDHFTIRCHPAHLPVLEAFYREVLGLHAGGRPPFPFPGHWMYVGDQAVVHLAATWAGPAGPAPVRRDDQGFDHVAFRAHGLENTRRRLLRLGIEFEEVPVPDSPLHQIFLHDPAGTKVELTFEVPR